jgi:hypothetical protein
VPIFDIAVLVEAIRNQGAEAFRSLYSAVASLGLELHLETAVEAGYMVDLTEQVETEAVEVVCLSYEMEIQPGFASVGFVWGLHPSWKTAACSRHFVYRGGRRCVCD